ncbi:MAG: hypothetical protein E3J72_02610 [Planctomycetota bacterium]|nr:MAG: hypothetical protein E3J72_02610 [Planctomycetota bacterium]
MNKSVFKKLILQIKTYLLAILFISMAVCPGCTGRRGSAVGRRYRLALPEGPTGTRIMGRDGRWLSIRCSLSEVGSDFEGCIRAGYLDPGSEILRPKFAKGAMYEREIKIPRGMKRSFTIHLLGAKTHYGKLLLELHDSRGRVLNAITPDYTCIPDRAFWIWVVCNPPAVKRIVPLFDNKDLLSPDIRPVETISSHVRPQNLPHSWLGYDSCDAMVICRASLDGISIQQEEALIDWVRTGGQLLVAYGTQSYKNTFLEEHLPVINTAPGKIELPRKLVIKEDEKKKEDEKEKGDKEKKDEGKKEKDGKKAGTITRLCALEKAIGQKGTSHGEIIRMETLKEQGEDSTTLVTEIHEPEKDKMKGYPVIVTRALGAGRITYCAHDLGREPFGNPIGFDAAFVSRIFAPVRRLESLPEFRHYAKNFLEPTKSGRTGGDPRALVIFALLVYIILISPVAYFFLKGRRWLRLGVFVTPGIVIAFSILLTFGALAVSRAESSVNSLVVLRCGDGTVAAEGVSFALFTTKETEIRVNTEPDALLSSAHRENAPRSFRVVQAERTQLRDFPVNWRGWTNLVASRLAESPGVTGDLVLSGRRLRNSVTNNSDFALDGCAVTYGRASISLGVPLNPGRDAALSRSFGPGYEFSITERRLREGANIDRETSLKYFLSAMRSGNVLPIGPGVHEAGFIGVSRNTDLSLETSLGARAEKTRTIVLASLPVRPGKDTILTSAMLPARWISGWNSNINLDSSGKYLSLISAGVCIREYVVPAGKTVKNILFKITAYYGGRSHLPRIHFRDWQEKKYIYEPLDRNNSIGLSRQNAGRYVQPGSGVIRLKLKNGKQYEDCEIKKIDLEVVLE